jgi:hypothetical protein
VELGFKLRSTGYFNNQWDGCNQDTRDLINKKIDLIRWNPFRFEKHESYKHVFKVKLTVDDKYSRLMYAVFMPGPRDITLLGIFPRANDYKDFDRIFGYLKKR